LIYRGKNDKFDKHNINEEITSDRVRLISEGQEPRIIPTKDALAMARDAGLDLVEITANQDPSVVKIVDYSKFKFEQIKKAKEAKKKQKVIHVKEIKMRPSIDMHDFEHKIKHSMEFLENGDKVKFTLMFRGRQMAHPELGFEVMQKVVNRLQDQVVIDKEISQEGKNITLIVSAKPGVKKQTPKEPKV
jgi:translation initiation factor IF-3